MDGRAKTGIEEEECKRGTLDGVLDPRKLLSRHTEGLGTGLTRDGWQKLKLVLDGRRQGPEIEEVNRQQAVGVYRVKRDSHLLMISINP